MNKRLIAPTLLLAAIGALAVVGYWRMFTTFMFYDDEGYVLLSLRNTVAHGGLYDRVFSQYGPFFHNFYWALHLALPFQFDHETSRWVTLVWWCVAALLCGTLVLGQTRNRAAAVATAAISFAYLEIMTNEPMHPGGLLAAMAAIGAAGGAWAIARGRTDWLAAGAGLLGVAMALTKINVGVFFLAAAGSWLLLNARLSPSRQRAAAWLVALGSAAAPFLLMHTLWAQTWVRTYVLVFASGALAWTIAWAPYAQTEHGARSWKLLVAWGGSFAAAMLAIAWWRGSSLAGLWHGIVLDPLRHPEVYSFAVEWRRGTVAVALGSLLLAGATRLRLRWWPTALAGLRLLLGAAFLAGALKTHNLTMPRVAFCYGVALAWMLSIPLQDGPATGAQRARGWLALVAIWQSLQAYPVAGSQAYWGTFLWVPLLISGGEEAVRYLAERAAAWRRALWGVAGLALAASAVASVGPLAVEGYDRYSHDQPLDLAGTGDLRLPDDFRVILRVLDENLRAHAGTVFSWPGLFSFNLWSGRPTPTQANVTQWFSLLSTAQQQAIVAELQADPRACLVVDRFLLDYLHQAGFKTEGPLVDFIGREFEKRFSVDGYEFWTRRGRTIAAYSIARLRPGDTPDRRRLDLTLQSLPPAVARVELEQLDPPYAVLQTLPFDRQQPWAITPLAPDGQATGPPTVAATGAPPSTGPVRLTTEFTPAKGLGRIDGVLVVLRQADGKTVGELRFAP